MLRRAFLIAGNVFAAATLGFLGSDFARLKSLPILGLLGVCYMAVSLLAGQAVYLGVGSALLVASYVSGFPPDLHHLLPLFLLLPVAVLIFSGYGLRRREQSADSGNALTYVGHLTAAVLATIALWPRFGAAHAPALVAALCATLIYSFQGIIKREGSHLLGCVLFSFVFFAILFTRVGGTAMPVYVALLLLPLAGAIFFVNSKERKLAEWLYAGLIVVALALSGYVSFQSDILVSTIVLALCGLSYTLLGLLAKRSEYIYLLTLTLGLFALNLVMSTADIFTWQLVSIIVYLIAGVGFVIAGLLLAKVIRYRRPFSLLIARNVMGAVVLLGPVITFVLIGLGSYSLRASENPIFCASCHNMKSQYEAWKNSAHSDVECVNCHRPPGLEGLVEEKMTGIVETVKFVTGQYSEKSHSQISDLSCTSKCHTMESLSEEIEQEGGSKFSHELHAEMAPAGIDLNCSSCHAHIKESEHFSVDRSVCFQCHFHGSEGAEPTFGSCTSCHDVPEEPVGASGVEFEHAEMIETGAKVECLYCHSNSVAGKGETLKQTCRLCHLEPTLEKADGVDIHEEHVTKFKVPCIQCHDAIEHGRDAVSASAGRGMGGDCSRCHMIKHAAAALLYSGKALKNAEGPKDPMYEVGVQCNGCHHIEKGNMVSPLASCDDCHGEDSGYAELVGVWQSDISEMAMKTDRLIAEARRLKGASGDRDPRVEKLVTFASMARDAVFADGSRGAHNYVYSSWLLESAQDSVTVALRLLRERS